MPRNHRYISFTDRVASIRIDPIRRSEQKRLVPDTDETSSLFITALERWNELNLSTSYTSFSYECTPLAQSLPMLLYNSQKVFDILINAVQKSDEHGMEPLLDILVNFARDLGEDFEPFYPKAVETCTDIILRNQKEDSLIETIELSFNCLASMFKFLARLLTQNLIPTYDLLLPLFGGVKTQKQRSFILRFAAESMAFLVRRAKNDDLIKIVEHIVAKVVENKSNEQYMMSSTQLLATTLKGPGNTLHSKTPTLLTIFYDSCLKHDATDLISHVLVEALHHARQETAEPIYKTILAKINESNDAFAARCLFIITGLRKGDRVSDFGVIFDACVTLGQSVANTLEWQQAAAAAVCFSDKVTLHRYIDSLLKVCPDVKTLAKVVETVNSYDDELISPFGAKILKLLSQRVDSESETELKTFALIMSDVKSLATSDPRPKNMNLVKSIKLEDVDGATSLFNLWWCLLVEPIEDNEDGVKLLDKVLHLNFKYSETLSAFQSNVAALIFKKLSINKINEKSVLKACELPFTPDLMDNLAACIANAENFNRSSLLEFTSSKIFLCLMSCDKSIRGSALTLLKVLVAKGTNDPQFLLDQCTVINDLPLNLENARNISHRIRQLASKFNFSNQDKNSTGAKAIVNEATLSFFLGMQSARLQPVLSAVISIIPKLAETAADLLCHKLTFLLEHPSAIIDSKSFMIDQGISAMEVEEDTPAYQIPDCNMLDAIQSFSETSWSAVESATDTLESNARKSLEFAHYDDLRTLSIKALCEIPQAAERYVIRGLVPHLLSAKEDEGEDEENEDSFDFKDKIALLELFAKLRNPQQLPDFDKVMEKYLYFLGSRHSPLQKLGLKCLLAANTPAVKVLRKYRENFDALLDDKRFSDELTGFICTGDDQKDETSLHPDDKDTIMPFIIRVLYGRAQNSSKRNLRHAVMSSMLFFDQKYIIMFINLAHSQLREVEDDNEMQTESIDRDTSRKYQGYLTLIHDFVHHLKGASEFCIPLICKEGLFPILRKMSLQGDKALRQLITKDLDEMLSSVPKKSVWDPLFPIVYETLISPQLENYGIRNLENLSTVAKLALTLSTEVELVGFIDKEIALAMISCLQYDMVKDAVVVSALKLVINLAANNPDSEVTSASISHLVQVLPARMDSDLTPECFSIAVDAVNRMFSLGLDTFDADVIQNLAEVSFKCLQKPSRIIPLHVKGSLLLALSQILSSSTCSLEIIRRAYDTLAPLFRQFAAPDARVHLSSCYQVFGERVPEFARVGSLIVELNSFDKRRLGDPDFERRSVAFEQLNEQLWNELSAEEWKPLVFNMLFFIRDPEELALRNNGKYSLLRVIECPQARDLVKEYVLPAIKRGLRDEDEKYRRTYIDLLSQCAKFDVLPTLNILLYNGDEEADFFINVNHVQVHRRRRAIHRLSKVCGELDQSVIAHYLLSIVENFATHSGSKNNDMNNLADDSLHAITDLLKHVSEGQFKSVARRCVKNVKLNPEPAKIRKAIRVVTSVAQATPRGIDEFVLNALVSPLHQILTEKSNEHENLPDRVPISVAIIYFMRSLNDETLELQLPGKLTALCQLLRSKIPEMRDTVRQSLSRIVRALGPKYLLFIVKELASALNRGGLQSHVLGFTVHSLLVELSREDGLTIGDTDDSAGLIFNIVMGDTFGSTGEEKDNEGYVTVAKEVKQHKSYDTAEILATWTSLSQFGKIVTPIRNFLSSTKLSTKSERKVAEVLRRLAAGLHKNSQASTQDSVVMGYEVFTLCKKTLDTIEDKTTEQNEVSKISGNLAARIAAAKESEKFFTVRLSSRDWYENGSNGLSAWDRNMRYASTNFHLLQSFALDTLRSVLTSTSGGAASDQGKGLLTVSNVKGLMPMILEGFESTHEDLNMAALKLATTALRLPVPFANGDNTLEMLGLRTLHFIESSPDTNSLICQTSLKFLTMLLRAKPEFELTTGAVAYIIERINPDLEEPERQGTAISFLRAIFTRKLMIPQVYDAADTLSKILVTNHSEHIRINCRAAYLQFLSSYPLGQTRLDRHLTSLGANLRYASPTGRLSTMQMISDLLQKLNVVQLESAFIQWYASLVLILVSDPEPRCRAKSSELLSILINSVRSADVFEKMAESCTKWLQSLGKNELLVRGGLETAKLFLSEDVAANRVTSASVLQQLRIQLRQSISEILSAGQRDSALNVDWQLIYLCLDNDVSDMMDLVEEVLLFPHPWVRARATRVFGHYFKTTPKQDIPMELLVKVGQKLVRQLGAPRLSTADSLQIVKDLVFIIPILDSERACRSHEAGETGDTTETLCIDWLITKLSSMIRTNVSAEEYVGTKTGAIQVLAALPSLVSEETTQTIAQEVIRCLFILNDQLTAENVHEELCELAQEAMSLYDKALGTTEYLKRYTAAKRFVDDRRRERRSKRSIQTVTDPEFAAQKRMKKNLHKRDVRKQKKHDSHNSHRSHRH